MHQGYTHFTVDMTFTLPANSTSGLAVHQGYTHFKVDKTFTLPANSTSGLAVHQGYTHFTVDMTFTLPANSTSGAWPFTKARMVKNSSANSARLQPKCTTTAAHSSHHFLTWGTVVALTGATQPVNTLFMCRE